MLFLGIVITLIGLVLLIFMIHLGIKTRDFTEMTFEVLISLAMICFGIYFLVAALSVHSYTMVGYVDNHTYTYENTTYITEKDNEIILLRDDNKIIRLIWSKNDSEFYYKIGDTFKCRGYKLGEWGSYTEDKIIKTITD